LLLSNPGCERRSEDTVIATYSATEEEETFHLFTLQAITVGAINTQNVEEPDGSIQNVRAVGLARSAVRTEHCGYE